MRPILPSERDRKRNSFATSRAQVLVQIHGDPDEPVQNADSAGFIVASGPEGKRLLREAYARFWITEKVEGEQPFGAQEVAGVPWTFRFVEPQSGLKPDDEIHVGDRVFQVTNPGGENSSSVQRDVQTIEIIS